MSVAMTNCGAVEWVPHRARYRYDAIDRLDRRAWPAMPAMFTTLM
jgi:alkylated DNA repair protein (DNA oxidative demethylase)